MGKCILIIAVIISINMDIVAQKSVNYDENGHKSNFLSETYSIKVLENVGPEPCAASILPSVLGSLIGVSGDVIKALLDAKEQSYTSTWNANYTGEGILFDNARVGIRKVIIDRKVLKTEKDTLEATKIVLNSELTKVSDGGLFRFKLDTIEMPYCKAKIKKGGKYGKSIDLDVNIELDAIWREYSLPKTDSTKKIVSKAGSESKTIATFVLKSGILGKSSIHVTGIKPGKVISFNKNNSNYSDWFQLIPVIDKTLASDQYYKRAGWYTLKISIKEANPFGVNSSKLTDFFKSNTSDIGAVLKAFIPDQNKK